MAVTRADGADFDALMAGADLTGKVGYLVKISGTGVILAGNTERAYGIVTEDGPQGSPITIQKSGLGKGVCGAAITAGVAVGSDGNGKIIATGTNSFGFARSGTANADEIVEVEIDRT